MPVTMLDAVEFSKIPSLQFVVPVVAVDPAAYEAGLIYNSTEKSLKFHNGTGWVALSSASAVAGGDLSGTYPNPQIAANAIVDADVNAGAAIAQTKIANLVSDLAAKALGTTDHIAGAGLTGGGTLAASRTFAVGAGTGILVGTDDVAVNTTVIQARSERGVANGYATLDGNAQIPTAQLPPLAINEVFVVATQAAMLALPAQRGDMAIRTDNGKTYVLSTDSPGTLADWKEVMATGQVVSVNGQTGVVTITAGTIGAAASSTTVTAGAGLTGGGALSGNITLDVVSANADMTVATDSIVINSAPKWSTARSFTLTGDVTGTVNLDGSANVSLATTVVGGSNLAKHFAGDVPAGASCVVTHNLNTRDVHVTVFRNTTPWDTVLCDVQRTSVNAVTLKFATAVTAAAFRCVVAGR